MNKKNQLDFNKSLPLHRLVREKILGLIQDGTFKNGDRLPPEETIAEENGISRGTVRTAFTELSREGIITRYPKRGTFVSIDRLHAKTIHIGVISPLLSLDKNEKNDYYQNDLLEGLQKGFLETRASFLFYHNNLKESVDIEQLFGRDIDGILFLLPSRKQSKILLKLQKKNIPMMIVGALPDGDFNFVGTDNRKGIEEAVQALVLQGHRKIAAVFASLDYFDSYHRHQGFTEALKKFSLRYNSNWVRILPRMSSKQWSEESLKLTKKILSRREKPTAIIAGGGFIALGVKKAIECKGFKIPSDISLIGFDDFYSAQYLTPPLTTISQPVKEIGELAVKKLVEIITNKIAQPYQNLLQTTLISRSSVSNNKR